MTSNKPPCPIDQALRVLHNPGERYEIRAIHPTGEFNGRKMYTDSLIAENSGQADDEQSNSEVVAKIKQWSAKNYNIFHGIQALRPDFVGTKKVSKRGKEFTSLAASKGDVFRLTKLGVDCDAYRFGSGDEVLAGSKLSATAEEKKHAEELGDKVFDFLNDMGFDPIRIDSGNGNQLLVHADLPPEDAELIQRFLEILGKKFDGPKAHIDLSVFDPSRVFALPGTQKMKGDNVPERPWREVQLLHEGSRKKVLDHETLVEILKKESAAFSAADPAKPKPPKSERSGIWAVNKNSAVGLELFLDHSQIPHDSATKFGDSTRFVLRTVSEVGGKKVSDTFCPNHAKHNSGSGPSTEAVFFGRDGRFGYQCSHSACSKVTWSDFRAYHEMRNKSEGREKFFAGLDDPSSTAPLESADDVIPDFPSDALEGDHISDFVHAICDGTAIPPQFARSLMSAVIQQAADFRTGYPGHENMRLRAYSLNISDQPRTGKGEAFKRCFGDSGLAKLLLAESKTAERFEHIEGTNVCSGQYCVAKIAEARRNRDLYLLHKEKAAPDSPSIPDPFKGVEIPFDGSDTKAAYEIVEISCEEDVYRILRYFKTPSERDIAVRLKHGEGEVAAAFKRDLKKAISLQDREIAKNIASLPVRPCQPSDDYLRVLLSYDELLSAYRNGDRSMEELLLTAFERTVVAHGSFTNGERRVKHTSLGMVADTTRKTFDELFTGQLSANSGFLHRCVLTYGAKRHVLEWARIDFSRATKAVQAITAELAKLPKSMIGGNERFVPQETDGAKVLRASFLAWLDQQDPRFTPELDTHFRRDVLTRVISSGSERIEEEHVRRGVTWAKYQFALRAALYPADCEEVVGQLVQKILVLLDKDPTVAWTDARLCKFLNLNSRNHGNSEQYNRARKALIGSRTVREFGINRQGHPLYQRFDAAAVVSTEDRERLAEYHAHRKRVA